MVLVVISNPSVGETSQQRSVDWQVGRGLSEKTFILRFQPASFNFGWREHPQAGMSASGVVKQLDVVEDRGRQLDPRLPLLAIEQLDLHAAPEALHHGVVVGPAASAP